MKKPSFLLRFLTSILIISFVVPAGMVSAFEVSVSQDGDSESSSEGDTSSDSAGEGAEKKDSSIEKPTINSGDAMGDVTPIFSVDGTSSAGRDEGGEDGGLVMQSSEDETGYIKTPENIKIFNVADIDGSFQTEIPIVIPPGRNGMNPQLRISYGSNSGTLGSYVGFGWSIDVPYIERINRSGVEKIYTENNFFSSMSGELSVASLGATTSTFLPRVDDGSFGKYELTNNIWTVYDRNGTRYSFGLTSQSRQGDATTTSHVFRWMVDTIQDANGNFIKYEYEKDGGQIYPKYIKYTGYGTDSGLYKVEFLKENLATSTISYKTSFPVTTSFRINKINIYVGSTLSRAYDFTYSKGNNKSRDLLGSVVEKGFESESQEVVLPARSFTYTSSQGDWVEDPAVSVPEEFIINYNKDSGTRIADVNGDGLPDIVRGMLGNPEPPEDVRVVYLNTGSGWALDTSWSLPEFFVEDTHDRGVYLIDVNGDMLPDIVKSWRGGDPYIEVKKVYLNTGHGWTLDTSWDIPEIFKSQTDGGVRFEDINSDGLVDLIRAWRGGDPYIEVKKVYLNTGHGWTLDTSWDIPEFFNFNNTDQGVRFADINGDGLMDLLISRRTSEGVINKVYRHIGDVSDKLHYYLLPQKGSVLVTYKGSAQYTGVGGVLNPNLPENLITVSSIAVHDGVGGVGTTTYVYTEGDLYYADSHDKKVSGFGLIIETDPIGNITKKYFHQGNQTSFTTGEFQDNYSKIGRPYLIETYDNEGNILSSIQNRWDSHNSSISATSSFLKLTTFLERQYGEGGTPVDRATTYEYDDLALSISREDQWGKVIGDGVGGFSDVGTDKTTKKYFYATSSDGRIVLPSRVSLVDVGSGLLSESKIYYDSLPLGSVSFGNKTKIENWKSGSGFVNEQSIYDEKGLIVGEINSLGATTTYAYDVYGLYPSTTTNSVGHIKDFQYDYSSGKPKKIVDENGKVTEFVYDGLDRVLSEKVSSPSLVSTLEEKSSYTYLDNQFPTGVVKTQYLDAGMSVPTYTYFDGFGRVIQERVQSEGDQDAFTVTKIGYDSRGLKKQHSLPFFVTDGSDYDSTPVDNNLRQEFSYDALGRVTSAKNYLGTTTTTYDGWDVLVKDPLNNQRKLYKDARGNLIRVDEYNGTSTYSTYYEYNGLNLLTKITDALGNIRSFTYDGLGRRLTAQDLHDPADTSFSTWSYSYDNAGNITQVVDGKGQTIQYTYDAINRPLTENFTGTPGVDVVYAYDTCAFGKTRLCQAVTQGATTTYAYDTAGRVVQEGRTISGATYTTAYAFNRQGNPTLITYPDGLQIQYEYNNGGFVERVLQKLPSATSFSVLVDDLDYSPEGKVSFQKNANGIEATNTYDANKLYRLTKKVTKQSGASGTKYQDLEYTYDKVGNITLLKENATTTIQRTVEYVYDNLYRLLSASTTAAATLPYRETYTYDAIGNILSKSDIGTYTYPSTSVKSQYANPHAVVSTPVTGTLTYDRNGNMLTGNGIATSTWDYKNRPTMLTVGPAATTYSYDHAGDRVVYAFGRNTTVYPNKYWNIEVSDDSGLSGSGGTTTTAHVFLGDQVVATIETHGTSTPDILYIHNDHLGGSSVITNSAGTSAETVDYYPYGATRLDFGLGYSEQRKFTGHEYDAETGLNYMGARYYAGNTGRFISVDPAFLAVGNAKDLKDKTGLELPMYLADPQSLNSYSYARNNPMVNVDRDGNFWTAIATMFLWPEVAYSPDVGEEGGSRSLEGALFVGSMLTPGGAEKKTGVKIAGGAEKIAIGGVESATNFVKSGFGSSNLNFRQKYNVIKDAFIKEGIEISSHGIDNIIIREKFGITAEKVMDAYRTGEKYFDSKYQQVVRYKDQVLVPLDNATKRIITVIKDEVLTPGRFKKID